MNEELVKCTGLCRSFEAVQALRGVDLSLTSGKIVGLLGPNGSGKTTLIKILNGLLQPTAGEARVAGLLPGVETKAITSYLPDRGYFPDWMRVGDMIDMFSDFYADFDRAKAEEMCRVLGLEAGSRIKTLSKGTREKMQLMLVMSRRARLYLLDEPIAGVDPAARDYILSTILSNYSEDASVLLSTHLNGNGIQTGIGFHGLLVGTVIILKIPVGISSRGIRGAVKAYIIIHQRDLAVDPLENLLDIVLGQSVLGQRMTIQGSGRNIQCHFRNIRLVPDLVLILLQRDRVAGTV